ncbi:MAG TPA: twin-arginine translocase subunit TatC [Lacipirellulaceae bacterium]|nr:twin-arginine translocase subunit TatC [Lacipirellulaceae bacterium]
MHRQYNEDLFESTKMTFGEHLEELRGSLVKATIALVAGVLIGLIFAGDVVDYVQTPLKQALEDYYSRLEAEEYRQHLDEQRLEGKPVPQDIDAAVKLFAALRLATEERLIHPRDLAESLAGALPQIDGKTNLPKRSPDELPRREDLVRIRFYYPIEDDPRVRVVGLGVQEPFVVYMKAAFVLGAVLASPFIFYFIWQFIAAGLYPHEQRYVHIFLPFSLGLFLAGAALAFFVVFKFVLAFLFTFFDWMGIDPDPRITDWLTFVLFLPLGFGISFQLPLVMLFLERIGIFTIGTYLSNWRISVLVICIIAMVLTPSDPYSMLLMAAPLILLFFFGIALCKLMPRRTTPFGEVIS